MRPKVPKHGRIKEKYRPSPNATEKRYWAWLRERGCEVCHRETSIHHVTTNGFKRLPRNHLFVVGLCPEHHQGDKGIHTLGHFKFIEYYYIDLLEVAEENYQDYENTRC